MAAKESIPNTTIVLQPGSLWQKTIQQTEYALQCGALQPILTDYEFVEQDGVRFLVRIISNLVRKDKAKKQEQKKADNKEFNPFLPYEPDLFVTDISNTHLCLLNKFNVVDRHLLIVTREFEDQDNWLTFQDFAALWACMQEFDGLAFYNGGREAGASQRHKHLQIIPLPLTPEGAKIPIAPLLACTQSATGITEVPNLPFEHAIVYFNADDFTSPQDGATVTLKYYYALLHAVGLLDQPTVTSPHQSAPYNLLVTRDWMLVVPRSQEKFNAISINSLGFAGALLVRDEQQMQQLKDCGPMTLLQQVACPQDAM